MRHIQSWEVCCLVCENICSKGGEREKGEHVWKGVNSHPLGSHPPFWRRLFTFSIRRAERVPPSIPPFHNPIGRPPAHCECAREPGSEAGQAVGVVTHRLAKSRRQCSASLGSAVPAKGRRTCCNTLSSAQICTMLGTQRSLCTPGDPEAPRAGAPKTSLPPLPPPLLGPDTKKVQTRPPRTFRVPAIGLQPC